MPLGWGGRVGERHARNIYHAWTSNSARGIRQFMHLEGSPWRAANRDQGICRRVRVKDQVEGLLLAISPSNWKFQVLGRSAISQSADHISGLGDRLSSLQKACRVYIHAHPAK
ncbi:hypothetical protein BC938DRAFT_475549 [Jimgerdemannia flammicorona]|uniref:Uncharacterized protein n=1 Tax=Jimgerdemannia flammicorona TaxID=994334 RepID=A0A433PSM8_9FUNG|nr:hypothetical protein BC938DRAFT_475549 [Jimgerdemannia flammicorona]